MDIINVFGNNLRKYRMQKGFTQEYLSAMSGLNRTYISDLECFRRNISLENVQRIATALGIDAYLLLISEDGVEGQ